MSEYIGYDITFGYADGTDSTALGPVYEYSESTEEADEAVFAGINETEYKKRLATKNLGEFTVTFAWDSSSTEYTTMEGFRSSQELVPFYLQFNDPDSTASHTVSRIGRVKSKSENPGGRTDVALVSWTIARTN